MKPNHGVLGIVCIVLGVALGAAEHTKSTTEPRIRISASIAKKDYRLDEPIVVDFKFENLTKRSLLILQPDAGCRIRQNGEELQSVFSIGPGMIPPWKLAPGEVRTLQKDARGKYIFPAKGGDFDISIMWRVTFLTEDGSVSADAPERGLVEEHVVIKPNTANQSLQPTAPSGRG